MRGGIRCNALSRAKKRHPAIRAASTNTYIITIAYVIYTAYFTIAYTTNWGIPAYITNSVIYIAYITIAIAYFIN